MENLARLLISCTDQNNNIYIYFRATYNTAETLINDQQEVEYWQPGKCARGNPSHLVVGMVARNEILTYWYCGVNLVTTDAVLYYSASDLLPTCTVSIHLLESSESSEYSSRNVAQLIVGKYTTVAMRMQGSSFGINK